MESMIQLQAVILEMIATGQTLQQTAEHLCNEVEALLPDVVCSVLTIDRAGLVHPLAAPSLPDVYCDALEGCSIGPLAGSCGTAAYLRQPVDVIDIATDERWQAFKHLVLPLGLRACWSSPILNAQGVPIGTFAFYYRENRTATDLEREIVRKCLHLCVIAIERHDRDVEHHRRAFNDALTDLPNRAAFDAALASLRCEALGSWALFVVDLDNLKTINDTFGHHVGDRLLKVVSARIAEISFPNRTFRIGGDEFAIILESNDALYDLNATAERILCALQMQTACGEHVIIPRATIGGAVLSNGDSSAEQVRQNADFALYHAKESGRGGFVQYWSGIGTAMTRRLTAIRDVTAALRENRIEAYYQPIVLLETREIVGLEALCRMRVGNQIISAAAFHEATTDAHVATELTSRMMSLVAADVRLWLDLGIPFQHVGINVSSADMHGRVDRMLQAAFAAEGVPLKHVILEVTETVYLGHGDRIVQNAIGALRAQGLRVALDDFGTGYASLTHLLTVPVDIIKVDKSFVDRLAPDDGGVAIVGGLIGIAAKMNLRVVAEGIETEEQAQQLISLGCRLGQGYLFSKAVNKHATTALLINRSQPQPTEANCRDRRESA